jgi:hypothetical protein
LHLDVENAIGRDPEEEIMFNLTDAGEVDSQGGQLRAGSDGLDDLGFAVAEQIPRDNVLFRLVDAGHGALTGISRCRGRFVAKFFWGSDFRLDAATLTT